MKPETGMPLSPDGTLDRDKIKAMFMASTHYSWTRFAEEHGWHALQSRVRLPVKSWIKEKRDALAETQMDTLSGLFHQRKFRWTHDVLKTLDDYPEAIDMGLQITKAKMSQIADMYKDYRENFLGQPDKMFYKGRRRFHPFESDKVSYAISSMASALKGLTDAKLKATMLDKWAIAKFEIPVEQEPPSDIEGVPFGPRITVEGKDIIDSTDIEKWFDRYADKPIAPPIGASAKTSAEPHDEGTEDGGS